MWHHSYSQGAQWNGCVSQESQGYGGQSLGGGSLGQRSPTQPSLTWAANASVGKSLSVCPEPGEGVVDGKKGVSKRRTEKQRFGTHHCKACKQLQHSNAFY